MRSAGVLPTIEIRLATRQDASAIVDMLCRLADETGDGDRFRSDTESIRKYGFGPSPLFQCLIAAVAERHVGIALFFPTYSSTRGQPGVYVQDLWVDCEMRSDGLGRSMLAAIADYSASQWDAGYMMLSVHDHNAKAMVFYKRLGFSVGDHETFLALPSAAFSEMRNTHESLFP